MAYSAFLDEEKNTTNLNGTASETLATARNTANEAVAKQTEQPVQTETPTAPAANNAPTYTTDEMVNHFRNGTDYTQDQLNAMSKEQWDLYNATADEYYKANPTPEMNDQARADREKNQRDMLSLSDTLAKKADYVVKQTEGDDDYKQAHDDMLYVRDYLNTHTLNGFDDKQIEAIEADVNAKYEEANKRRGHAEVTWDALKKGYWTVGDLLYKGGMMMKPGGLTQENAENIQGAMAASKDLDIMSPARVGNVQDIGSVGDAVDWAIGVAGENAPRMLVGVAGTALGAFVGGPVGAAVGGTLMTMAQNTGEAVGDQMDENRNDGDIRNSRGWALLQGSGYSLLDGAFGASAWGGKIWGSMLKQLGTKQLVKGATVDAAKELAKTASIREMAKELFLKGMLFEGGQETLQSQGVGRLVRYLQTGTPFKTMEGGKKETWAEVGLEALNEFAGGAVAGLGIGSVTAASANADARVKVNAQKNLLNMLKDEKIYRELDDYSQLLVTQHLINDANLETTNTLSENERLAFEKSNAEIDAEIDRMSKPDNKNDVEKLQGQSARAYLDLFKSQYTLDNMNDVMAWVKDNEFISRDGKKFTSDLSEDRMRAGAETHVQYKDGKTTWFRLYTDKGISIAEELDKDGNATGKYAFNNDPERKSPIFGKDEIDCTSFGEAFVRAQQLDAYNQWRAEKMEAKAEVANKVFEHLFGKRGVNLKFVDRPTAGAVSNPTYSYDQESGKTVRSGSKLVGGTTANYNPETNTVELSLDNVNSLGSLYTTLVHERTHEDIVDFMLKSGKWTKKVGAKTVVDWVQFDKDREALFEKVINPNVTSEDDVREFLANSGAFNVVKDGQKTLNEKALDDAVLKLMPDVKAKGGISAEMVSALYRKPGNTSEWGKSAGVAGEEMVAERNSVWELANAVRNADRGLFGSVVDKVRQAVGVKMALDMNLDPAMLMSKDVSVEMNKLLDSGYFAKPDGSKVDASAEMKNTLGQKQEGEPAKPGFERKKPTYNDRKMVDGNGNEIELPGPKAFAKRFGTKETAVNGNEEFVMDDENVVEESGPAPKKDLKQPLKNGEGKAYKTNDNIRRADGTVFTKTENAERPWINLDTNEEVDDATATEGGYLELYGEAEEVEPENVASEATSEKAEETTGETRAETPSAEQPKDTVAETPKNAPASAPTETATTAEPKAENAPAVKEEAKEAKPVVKTVEKAKKEAKPKAEPKAKETVNTETTEKAEKTPVEASAKTETNKETVEAPKASEAVEATVDDKPAKEEAPATEIKVGNDNVMSVPPTETKPKKASAKTKEKVLKYNGLSEDAVQAEDWARWSELNALPDGTIVSVGRSKFEKVPNESGLSDGTWIGTGKNGKRKTQLMIARLGDFKVSGRSETPILEKMENASEKKETKKKFSIPDNYKNEDDLFASINMDGIKRGKRIDQTETEDADVSFEDTDVDYEKEYYVKEIAEKYPFTTEVQRKFAVEKAKQYGKIPEIKKSPKVEGTIGIYIDNDFFVLEANGKTPEENRIAKEKAEDGSSTRAKSVLINFPEIPDGMTLDDYMSRKSGADKKYNGLSTLKLFKDAFVGRDYGALRRLWKSWTDDPDGIMVKWLRDKGVTDERVQDWKELAWMTVGRVWYRSNMLELDRIEGEKAIAEERKAYDRLTPEEKKEMDGVIGRQNAPEGTPIGRTVSEEGFVYGVMNFLWNAKLIGEDTKEESAKRAEQERVSKIREAEKNEKLFDEDEKVAAFYGISPAEARKNREIEESAELPDEYKNPGVNENGKNETQNEFDLRLCAMCIDRDGIPADPLARKAIDVRISEVLSDYESKFVTGKGEFSRFGDVIDSVYDTIHDKWEKGEKAGTLWVNGPDSNVNFANHVRVMASNLLHRELKDVGKNVNLDDLLNVVHDQVDAAYKNPFFTDDEIMTDIDVGEQTYIPELLRDESDEFYRKRMGYFETATKAAKHILASNLLTYNQKRLFKALIDTWKEMRIAAYNNYRKAKDAGVRKDTLKPLEEKYKEALRFDFDDAYVMERAAWKLEMAPMLYKARIDTVLRLVESGLRNETGATNRDLQRGLFTPDEANRGLSGVAKNDAVYKFDYDVLDIINAMRKNGDGLMALCVTMAEQGESDNAIQKEIESGKHEALRNENGAKSALGLLEQAYVDYGWMDRRFDTKTRKQNLVVQAVDKFKNPATFKDADGDHAQLFKKVREFLDAQDVAYDTDELFELFNKVVKENVRIATRNSANQARKLVANSDHDRIAQMLDENGNDENAVKTLLEKNYREDQIDKMFAHYRSIEKANADREAKNAAKEAAKIALAKEKEEKVAAEKAANKAETERLLAENPELRERLNREAPKKDEGVKSFDNRDAIKKMIADGKSTDAEIYAKANELGVDKTTVDNFITSIRDKATAFTDEELAERAKTAKDFGVETSEEKRLGALADMEIRKLNVEKAAEKKREEVRDEKTLKDADRIKKIVDEVGKENVGKKLMETGISSKRIDDMILAYAKVYGNDAESQTSSKRSHTRMSNSVTPAEDSAYMDAVKRGTEYANARTEKLAPNGKRSNLSNALYHLVRTERFKKWFGDWEKVLLQKFLEGTPVASARGDEYLNVNDNDVLRDLIYDGYKRVNWRVKNPHIGIVELTKSGIRDSISKGLGRAKIAAFDYIPEIIENGMVVNDESNWKGRGYDTSVITAPISIGGKQYAAFVVVRKHSNGNNNFYLHEVGLIEDIKNETERLRTGSSDDSALSRPFGLVKSIALSIFSVNADSVSKIIDENGEPLVVYHSVGSWYVRDGSGGFTKFDGAIAKDGFMFRGSKDWVGPDGWGARNNNGKGEFKTVFLDIKNPLIVDASGANYTRIPNPLIGYLGNENGIAELVSENKRAIGELRRDESPDASLKRSKLLHTWEYFSRMNGKYVLPDAMIHVMHNMTDDNFNEFDGVIIKNVDEGEKDGVGDDYITDNPYAIKSADPVTYDDDDNVIPLSERFNLEKSDIRFHTRGGTAMSASDENAIFAAMENQTAHGISPKHATRQRKRNERLRKEAESVKNNGGWDFRKIIERGRSGEMLNDVEIAAIVLDQAERYRKEMDGHLTEDESAANMAVIKDESEALRRSLSEAGAALAAAKFGIDIRTMDTAVYITQQVRNKMVREAEKKYGNAVPPETMAEIEKQISEKNARIQEMEAKMAELHAVIDKQNAEIAKKNDKADAKALNDAAKEELRGAYEKGVAKGREIEREEDKRRRVETANKFAKEFGLDERNAKRASDVFSNLSALTGVAKRFAGNPTLKLDNAIRGQFAILLDSFGNDERKAREAVVKGFGESMASIFDKFVEEQNKSAVSPDGSMDGKRKARSRNVRKIAEESETRNESEEADVDVGDIVYSEEAEYADSEVSGSQKKGGRKSVRVANKTGRTYLDGIVAKAAAAIEHAIDATDDATRLQYIGEYAREAFKILAIKNPDRNGVDLMPDLAKSMSGKVAGLQFDVDDAKDAMMKRGDFKAVGRKQAKASDEQLRKAAKFLTEHPDRPEEAAAMAGLEYHSDNELLVMLDNELGRILNDKLNVFESRISEADNESLSKQIHELIMALHDIRSGKPAKEMLAKYLELAPGMKRFRRQKSLLERINSYIEMYTRKLENNDFEPPPKRETPDVDKELKEIRHRMMDLERLRQRFKHERDMWKIGKGPFLSRQFSAIGEILGEIKAVVGSMDLSSVLRQGGQMTWAHPVLALKNVKKTLEILGDEKKAQEAYDSIFDRPNAKYYGLAGIDFSIWGDNSTSAEDLYLLNQYRKITKMKLVKMGVECSERAFSMYLNLMRADVFDAMVANSPFRDASNMTVDQLKALGAYVNVASGRGMIDKTSNVGKALKFLNSIFWSPRNIIARFQFVTETAKLLIPGFSAYGTKDFAVRKAIAMETARYLTGVGIAIVFTKLMADLFRDDDEPPQEIVFDPRSSSFLEVKVGNTHLDFLSGLKQMIVCGSRLFSGKTVNARGQEQKLNRYEYVGRFLRSKFAPASSIVYDTTIARESYDKQDILWAAPFAKNKDEIGIVRYAFDQAIPLSFNDVADQFKENGIGKSFGTVLLSLLGAGANTYDANTYKQLKGDFRYYKKIYAAAESNEERERIAAMHPHFRRMEGAIEAWIKSAEKYRSDISKIEKMRDAIKNPDKGTLAGIEKSVEALKNEMERCQKIAVNLMVGIKNPTVID